MICVIKLRETLLVDAKNRFQRDHKTSFALLEQAQTIKIPGKESRYFFSYSVQWKGKTFKQVEELPFDQFFLLAEGENVQIQVMETVPGEIYSKISQNPLPPYGKLEQIFSISSYLLGISLLLMGAGFLIYIFQ